mgnify:CR=1 FL=1
MARLTKELREIREAHEDDTGVEIVEREGILCLRQALDMAGADGVITPEERRAIERILDRLHELHEISLNNNRAINRRYHHLTRAEGEAA